MNENEIKKLAKSNSIFGILGQCRDLIDNYHDAEWILKVVREMIDDAMNISAD